MLTALSGSGTFFCIADKSSAGGGTFYNSNATYASIDTLAAVQSGEVVGEPRQMQKGAALEPPPSTFNPIRAATDGRVERTNR